jgi:drug/metabolite transporter (DMT)-like permease
VTSTQTRRDGASAATRTWLPVAAVATTLVLWASAFVAIRHLADDFSAGPLALGRNAVGAVALLGLALPRFRRPAAGQWWRLVVIGLLWYAVYNVALNRGEQLVDAGTASLVLQAAPVMVALLAAVFLGERFTATKGVGLTLAIAGVTLISLSGSEPGELGGELVGVLLCALAALVYAVSLIVQKPLMATLPAIEVTAVACAVGALACLPFAGTLADEMAAAPTSSVWWMAYLGLFPTAIGFTCYAYALNHMPASNLAVTTYLIPVITIVMAWLLLDETPASLAYLGGVITLVGVAVARRRPRPVPA